MEAQTLDAIAASRTRLMDLVAQSASKALVVDDIPHARQGLKAAMKAIGVRHIDMASDAESAYRFMKRSRYDIVLSDLNLPKKSGSWLLEAARESGVLAQDAVFMIISGEMNAERVNPVMTIAPDDFLLKPFSERQLQTRLLRCLEQKLIIRECSGLIYGGECHKAVLQELLERFRGNLVRQVAVFKAVGEVLLMQERFHAAIEHFKEAKSKFQGHHRQWILSGKARAYFGLNELERCIEKLNELLEVSPHSFPVLSKLAVCYEKCGQYQEALHYVKSALFHQPKNVELLERMVMLGIELEDQEVVEQAKYRLIGSYDYSTANITRARATSDHLQSCITLIEEGCLEGEAYDRFKASLTALRKNKQKTPTDVSNGFRAELLMALTLGNETQAKDIKRQWDIAIEQGRASPMTNAQELTLRKRFNL